MRAAVVALEALGCMQRRAERLDEVLREVVAAEGDDAGALADLETAAHLEPRRRSRWPEIGPTPRAPVVILHYPAPAIQ